MQTIIINGVTSFTGYWISKILIDSKKYKIITILNNKKKNYIDLKKKRLNKLKPFKEYDDAKFGSKKYQEILNNYKNFTYIHHSAYTKNYNYNFNINKAISENLKSLNEIFKILKNNNCKEIILTESYHQKFNKYKNYSLYAKSKYLTSRAFEKFSKKYKIKLRKNRIANPFGPLEEKRFLYYIISKWKKNESVLIKSPNDKNDFVPVDILAKNFLNFLKSKKKILNVSGLYLSNYQFALIIKKNLEKLLKKKLIIKKTNLSKSFDRKNSNNSISYNICLNSLKNYLAYCIKEY